MESHIIYEYEPNIFNAILFTLPFIFFLIISIWYFKNSRSKLSIKAIPVYLVKFFLFIVSVFSIFYIIVMLIYLPREIQREIRVKQFINNGNYSVIEGKVESYKPDKLPSNIKHFEINGKGLDIYCRSRNQLKESLENNQDYRVYYFSDNGNNIVLKMEKK